MVRPAPPAAAAPHRRCCSRSAAARNVSFWQTLCKSSFNISVISKYTIRPLFYSLFSARRAFHHSCIVIFAVRMLG